MEFGEFQLATREQEFEELKVCNLLLRRVKELEIAVNAQVAKHWRIGDAKRAEFEEVARSSTEQVEEQVAVCAKRRSVSRESRCG
ncbi:hypothetical protein Aduo_001421 [Ancylostoma duodenale]